MLSGPAADLVQQHTWLPRALILKGHWRLSMEDLLGVGSLALVTAAVRYDPTRGVLFRTYATHRVRGALLDAEAKERGQARLATTPTSLLAEWHGTLPATDEAQQRHDLQATVAAALTQLPPRERFMLYMYFWHEVPVHTVAAALGVTPRRCLQLRATALERLRPLLQGVA